jgi:DNA-binding NarL/FixJ family response regulator
MNGVVVFTDEPLLLLGLQCAMANIADLSFSYVADVRTLVSNIQSIQPEAVLLDLPPDSELGILKDIHDAAPRSRVILWARELAPEIAWQAVEHGARGVIRKTNSAAEVVACLRAVRSGELWFDQSLTATLLTMRPVHLTRREGELISLLAHGLKNKEIATALNISEGTVKVYISRLFEKVGAKDRLELALYGLRNMNRSTRGVTRESPRIDRTFRSMVFGAPA